MGAIALLALFMLLHARSSSSSSPSLPPRSSSGAPVSPVARAHAHARATRQRAAETGNPADVKAADQAAAAAQKATQQQKATVPVSASPVPAGLPAFPAGWQPDNPPPAAVQQRASQLLPTLWAKGAGATKTEQTGGRWITYQAAVTSPGKKGVVAFRVKPSATQSANA